MLVPCDHGWVLSPPLLAQDAFIKSCRRKVERISEDDLYTEGEFMSEQDMIDDNYKENLVTYTCIYSSWVPSCKWNQGFPN